MDQFISRRLGKKKQRDREYQAQAKRKKDLIVNSNNFAQT